MTKAEAPESPEPGQGQLKIDLWVDRGDGGIYLNGDLLHIYFHANQDCYLRLLYRDASGNNFQIFPNQYDEYNRITAGKTYTIPDETDNFDFEIQAPFGAELITAFACTEPFGQAGMRNQGIITLPGKTSEIWDNFRGMIVKKREAKSAEAACVITTVPSK